MVIYKFWEKWEGKDFWRLNLPDLPDWPDMPDHARRMNFSWCDSQFGNQIPNGSCVQKDHQSDLSASEGWSWRGIRPGVVPRDSWLQDLLLKRFDLQIDRQSCLWGSKEGSFWVGIGLGVIGSCQHLWIKDPLLKWFGLQIDHWRCLRDLEVELLRYGHFLLHNWYEKCHSNLWTKHHLSVRAYRTVVAIASCTVLRRGAPRWEGK